jgi:mRNA interferase RelE/StbE
VGYRITWSNKAKKDFRKLDRPVQRRVGDTIDALAENPRPVGVEPVVSMPGVLRVRQEDYRVLYRVDEDEREVWIEDVRPRDKAYRKR